VSASAISKNALDMRQLGSSVAGDNGRILYSIGSGDDDGDFSIAQNGTIYTTRPLDRETKSLYNLVVVATDQARAPQQSLSSTVQVWP
jgi:protocadherin Fat 4